MTGLAAERPCGPEETPMQGNPKIIERLNLLLADELSAINQYMVHSEMCANWGYEQLHHAVELRARDEMKHAEKLIGRILFLEGRPDVTRLSGIRIGNDVGAQHRNDQDAELGAIKAYNDAIRLVEEAGDHGTRELLESILKDEESHLDALEARLGQIADVGLPGYLAEQMG
jgi:bacterioferritin